MVDFFDKADSLEIFASVHHMLKPAVRALAAKIASHLIIKVARQIADTGYRSGSLKLTRGFGDGAEIELDRSIENYVDQPVLGILSNIVSYSRQKERIAFVLMIDQSFSMKGLKVILAAITAAVIVRHFRNDCVIISFNSKVQVLKKLNQNISAEKVLEMLFEIPLLNGTDITGALKKGIQSVSQCERKIGLLLTDGAWTEGDPLPTAAHFDKLNVIGFPPLKPGRIQQLAVQGGGEFTYINKETEIAAAILKCLS